MQIASELVAELVAARLAGGETCVLVVCTGSMAPLLRPGDAVRVAPLGGRRPQCGTVLVVRQGNFLVTHRLVGWTEADAHEQLLLQGDACPRPDRPVAASAVLGVVVAHRRGGRWRNLGNRGWGCKDVMSWACGVFRLLLRQPQILRRHSPKTSLPGKSIIAKEQA